MSHSGCWNLAILGFACGSALIQAEPPSSEKAAEKNAVGIEELLAQLDGPDKFARQRAAVRIGELGPAAKKAVPILQGIVRTVGADEDVRFKAAVSLARLAHSIEEADGALIELLKDCSDRTCLFAAEAWRRARPPLSPESTAALEALIRHDDPLVRRRAIGVFADGDPAAKPVVPALIDALGTGGGAETMASMGLLRLAKEDAETADRLISALGDHAGKHVRRHCAELIGLLGPRVPQAAIPLLRALHDPVEEVREAALDALRRPFMNTGVPVTESDAPALLAALQSDDEWIRDAAARFFRQPPEPERDWKAKVLGKALKHPGTQVRATAASCLWQVDTGGTRVSSLILEAASDPEPTVRRAAVEAACGFSAPPAGALVALVAATDDPDPSVRATVARKGRMDGVSWVGADAKDAVPRIVPYLSDDNMTTRLAAVIALGRIGPDARDALPELVDALRTDDTLVRNNVALSFRLIARGTPGVVDDLAEAFDHPDARIRSGIAKALGDLALHSEGATRLLVKMITSDNDRGVLGTAARALGKHSESAKLHVPQLIRELANDNVGAARALGKLESEAVDTVPALVAALERTSDTEFRLAAVQSLGQLGSKARAAAPVLLSMLPDSDYRVRWAAATAVGDIDADPALALPRLIPLLQTDSSYLCGHVIRTIGKIGSSSPEAVDALVALLSHERAVLRRGAILALAEIGTNAGSAIGNVTTALNDDDSDVREAAARAIPHLGPAARNAVPALVAALADRHRKVRRAALRSLGEMGPAAESALPALEDLLARERKLFYEQTVKDVMQRIRSAASDTESP